MPNSWVVALDVDFNETKGNFTGYTWYMNGTAQSGDPTGNNAMQVGDTVNWAVSASNLPSGGQLTRLVLTVGRFHGNSANNPATQATPFFSGSGAAQCWLEQTGGPWSTPVPNQSAYQGFSNAAAVSQDPGAKGNKSKYEFTLVAVYQDSGGNTREFGCDPEIDVDNGT